MVSAVDIDLFANCVTRVEQLEELQHLIFKLRRTKQTVNTLESTHHSVCRAFLRFKETDRLLHILNDRVGFGIFADQFCYNMILDQFIESKNYRNAAKVATLIMLSEECDNQITRVLALYSVHMYLRDENRLKWYDGEDKTDQEEKAEDNNEDEDEDDIQYIRVPVLRNEWFDDHFDIRDPMHLCGKTLHFFGKQFDDIVGRTYQLIGLVLYEKWDKTVELLRKFLSSREENLILKKDVNRVENIVSKMANDCAHKEKALEVIKILNQMKTEGKIVDKDLHELVCEKLSTISQLEAKDMEEMPLLFKEWENLREQALNKQIEDLLREEKKKEILKKKKEISEKNRYLFFFENFSKHEIDFVEAEKRIEELKSKTLVDEDYIPPEI